MKYESRGFKGIIQQQGNTFSIDTFVGGHLIVAGEKGTVNITRFSTGILTIHGKIRVNITFMNAGLIDLGSGVNLSVKHFDAGSIYALEHNSISIVNFTQGEIDAGEDNYIYINNRRKDTVILVGDRNDCTIRSGRKDVIRNRKKQELIKIIEREIFKEDA